MPLRCLSHSRGLQWALFGRRLHSVPNSKRDVPTATTDPKTSAPEETKSHTTPPVVTGPIRKQDVQTTESKISALEETKTYTLPQKYDEPKTAFALFNSDFNLAINWITFVNRFEFSPRGYRRLRDEYKWKKLIGSQAHLPARAEFLGSELAAAHFICFRGGKVRFFGQTEWHIKEEGSDELPTLPSFYNPDFKTEALDCSSTELIYEGLENLRGLENLKWLSLEGCPHVDDWFLDRVAGEFGHSLEYLNIKDCSKVTEKGIACLTKIKNLKTLHLGGQPKAQHLELVCLLLEDVLPELSIRGIVYCDESLLTTLSTSPEDVKIDVQSNQ